MKQPRLRRPSIATGVVIVPGTVMARFGAPNVHGGFAHVYPLA